MWHLTLCGILLISVGMFINNSRHILGSLVLLEFIVVIVYAMLSFGLFNASAGAYSMIVLFVVSVSAAGVGLSLLIPLARSHGKDYFSSFKLLW